MGFAARPNDLRNIYARCRYTSYCRYKTHTNVFGNKGNWITTSSSTAGRQHGADYTWYMSWDLCTQCKITSRVTYRAVHMPFHHNLCASSTTAARAGRCGRCCVFVILSRPAAVVLRFSCYAFRHKPKMISARERETRTR